MEKENCDTFYNPSFPCPLPPHTPVDISALREEPLGHHALETLAQVGGQRTEEADEGEGELVAGAEGQASHHWHQRCQHKAARPLACVEETEEVREGMLGNVLKKAANHSSFLVCRGCKHDVVMLGDVHVKESSKSSLFFLICRGCKSNVVMLRDVHKKRTNDSSSFLYGEDATDVMILRDVHVKENNKIIPLLSCV